MFCYHNKQLLSALGLITYELEANKKCQVSLVVKYIYMIGCKLYPYSSNVCIFMMILAFGYYTSIHFCLSVHLADVLLFIFPAVTWNLHISYSSGVYLNNRNFVAWHHNSTTGFYKSIK